MLLEESKEGEGEGIRKAKAYFQLCLNESKRLVGV